MSFTVQGHVLSAIFSTDSLRRQVAAVVDNVSKFDERLLDPTGDANNPLVGKLPELTPRELGEQAISEMTEQVRKAALAAPRDRVYEIRLPQGNLPAMLGVAVEYGEVRGEKQVGLVLLGLPEQVRRARYPAKMPPRADGSLDPRAGLLKYPGGSHEFALRVPVDACRDVTEALAARVYDLGPLTEWAVSHGGKP